MPNAPKKKTIAWIILFGITGVVDAIQIIVSLTGVGIAISEIMELAMPFIIVGLLVLFGIPILSKPTRLMSIVGVTFGDSITGGIAPFWILDIFYLYSSIKSENAQILAKQEQEMALTNSVRQPLYKDGMRQPNLQTLNKTSQPMNIDGIRAPGGGLNN